MRTECVLIGTILLSGLMAGCAYEGRRVPASDEPVMTQEFNPTDLQKLKVAVDELLAKGVLPRSPVPVAYVARVRNLSDEHVNTEAITEFVAYHVGNSGRVQLTEVTKGAEEAVRQLSFQQGALFDPATTKKAGRMVGADFFLLGELTNISTRSGRRRGQFFQFTLTLVEIETLKSWKAQVHIQKVAQRGIVGW